ncbi:unnamed protein product [Sphagnum balticum]
MPHTLPQAANSNDFSTQYPRLRFSVRPAEIAAGGLYQYHRYGRDRAFYHDTLHYRRYDGPQCIIAWVLGAVLSYADGSTCIQAPLVVASGAIGFSQYLTYLIPGLDEMSRKAISGGLVVLITILLYRDRSAWGDTLAGGKRVTFYCEPLFERLFGLVAAQISYRIGIIHRRLLAFRSSSGLLEGAIRSSGGRAFF